jgi:hypothetical protein
MIISFCGSKIISVGRYDQNLDQGAKFAQFSKCSDCDENGAIASVSSS